MTTPARPDPWADVDESYTPVFQPTPAYVSAAIGTWADPETIDAETLASRFTYENGGRVRIDKNGMPQNPAGPTGKSGRLLGKWGPNHAADPIVFRHHPDDGGLEMLAILRKDTGEWAIPGGMCDAGEALSDTLARELKEETNVTLDLRDARVVYRGINANDPRNTDAAWMETNVTLTVLDAKTAASLDDLQAGDDAAGVRWMRLCDAEIAKLYASHADYVKRAIALYRAVGGATTT